MDTSFDLRVLDVVVETDDARSVVLEVPEELVGGGAADGADDGGDLDRSQGES